MGFQNHSHRGALTIQAHTVQDVFVQVPVCERAAVQTDEYELDYLPVPPIDPTTVSAADKAAFIAWYESRTGTPLLTTWSGGGVQTSQQEWDAYIFGAAYVREMSAAYFRAHFPDHDLSQNAAHQVTEAPSFLPLNLDVRQTKRLHAHYHDLAGRNEIPYLDDIRVLNPATRPVGAPNPYHFGNKPSSFAYRVMICLEYEEPIPPTPAK